MRRRDFISLLGGAAVTPLAARAQQGALPVIGYLTSGSSESDALILAAFQQGLNESGYVEGKNVEIEYRWGAYRYDKMPEMAADLAKRKVVAIAAIGGTPTALIAKAATSTVPVVFYLGIDPIKSGLVASLNRPGGNMTGVAALQADLVSKRVQFLRELVPNTTAFALLVNPMNPYTEAETRGMNESVRSFGLQLNVLHASTPSEIGGAFETLANLRAGALVVSADTYLLSRRQQIVAMAARNGLPAMYPWREYADTGGLMCYGPNLSEAYRRVGNYVGRILKGAKPAELPVEQTTKVEFVINLKSAKTLNLTFPVTLLGRADEVIE